MIIYDPVVINVTNNLETFKEEGIHHVSVSLLARSFSGELKTMEPDKCDGWFWCDPYDLPQPHFDASVRGIDMYISKIFYKNYDNSLSYYE